jgi:hypothetical protein
MCPLRRNSKKVLLQKSLLSLVCDDKNEGREATHYSLLSSQRFAFFPAHILTIEIFVVSLFHFYLDKNENEFVEIFFSLL